MLNYDLSDHQMVCLSVDLPSLSYTACSHSTVRVSVGKLVSNIKAYNWDIVTDSSSVHDDCLLLTTKIMQCVQQALIECNSSSDTAFLDNLWYSRKLQALSIVFQKLI